MTPNQLKTLARQPKLQSLYEGIARGTLPAVQSSISLPVCDHRGKLIDKTSCRCHVYTCEVHGTCSNSSRAGLTVCPCESYTNS